MGRPRRVSKNFLREERGKLYDYRRAIRRLYDGELPTASDEQLLSLYEVPTQLLQGQRVIILEPRSGDAMEGVVKEMGEDGSHTYQVHLPSRRPVTVITGTGCEVDGYDVIVDDTDCMVPAKDLDLLLTPRKESEQQHRAAVALSGLSGPQTPLRPIPAMSMTSPLCWSPFVHMPQGPGNNSAESAAATLLTSYYTHLSQLSAASLLSDQTSAPANLSLSLPPPSGERERERETDEVMEDAPTANPDSAANPNPNPNTNPNPTGDANPGSTASPGAPVNPTATSNPDASANPPQYTAGQLLNLYHRVPLPSVARLVHLLNRKAILVHRLKKVNAKAEEHRKECREATEDAEVDGGEREKESKVESEAAEHMHSALTGTLPPLTRDYPSLLKRQAAQVMLELRDCNQELKPLLVDLRSVLQETVNAPVAEAAVIEAMMRMQQMQMQQMQQLQQAQFQASGLSLPGTILPLPLTATATGASTTAACTDAGGVTAALPDKPGTAEPHAQGERERESRWTSPPSPPREGLGEKECAELYEENGRLAGKLLDELVTQYIRTGSIADPAAANPPNPTESAAGGSQTTASEVSQPQREEIINEMRNGGILDLVRSCTEVLCHVRACGSHPLNVDEVTLTLEGALAQLRAHILDSSLYDAVKAAIIQLRAAYKDWAAETADAYAEYQQLVGPTLQEAAAERDRQAQSHQSSQHQQQQAHSQSAGNLTPAS